MNAPFFLCATALKSLAQHKGRSLLTIVSIVIGIAAVVATLAIGRGAEEKIRKNIERMGKNFLMIYAGGRNKSGVTAAKKKKRTKWLTYNDISLFKEQCPAIKALSATFYGGNALVSSTQQKILSDIEGVEAPYFSIKNIALSYGRLFNSREVLEQHNVVVLGSKAAQLLFKATPPLGQSVLIKNQFYTVIGVLKPRDNGNSFRDSNTIIYMPATTCSRKINHIAPWYVHGVVLSTYAPEDMPRVQRTLRRILRHKHALSPDDNDDFTIWNQSSMAQAAEQSSAIFNLFLLIVASLSLLVGGIGVMNIMLVSVTERTKEIGIRMALGATKRMILAQFLIESLVLCSIGGLLGMLLGVAVPHAAARFTQWLVIVTPGSLLISLLITCCIGILFGYWPAYKASKLNPVEALLDR